MVCPICCSVSVGWKQGSPNAIVTGRGDKVLVGTDGQSIDLFLPESVLGRIVETDPLRLERDLAVADARPSFPKSDRVVVYRLAHAAESDSQPAVQSMTDMVSQQCMRLVYWGILGVNR